MNMNIMVFIPNSHQKIMKKHYYLYVTVIIALVVALPSITRAEQGANDTNVDVDASVQTNTPAGVRVLTPFEKLRAAKDVNKANIQKNEDARNRMLELEKQRKMGSTTSSLRPGLKGDIRLMASSTRAERQEIGDDRRSEIQGIRQQGREDIKNAPTDIDRREIRKDMRKNEFQARKNALVKQLNVSLNNLRQIRERIATRIQKASSEGRNMTEAKRLLVIADGKIILAQQAVRAVMDMNPNVTASSTATTSLTIDLGKPREIGDVAIKALRQANEALIIVVRAIAHSMGLGNASSTPPVITPAIISASTTTAI